MQGNAGTSLLEFSSDFFRFLGFWYGEGYLLADGDFEDGQVVPLEKILGLGVTVPADNTHLLTHLHEVLQGAFGIEPRVFSSPGTSEAFVSVVMESRALGIAFSKLFGQDFSTKRLYAPINDIDDELLRSFLQGLSISDPNILEESGAIALQRFNPEFLAALFHLMRARGWLARLELDETEPSGLHLVYPFCHIEGGANGEDGRLKVESVGDTLRTDELVYNLGVEDDHSYMAGGIVVQNCYLLSLGESQDSIEGIFDALKSCALLSKWGGGETAQLAPKHLPRCQLTVC
jgi:hypothetical protein